MDRVGELGKNRSGCWGREGCLKFVQLCHVRESKGVPALYSDDSLSRGDEPCLPYPKTA
jgi:hypothetical protein